MTETRNSGTDKLLVFLVLLLVAATAVQGFFLFRIYRGRVDIPGAKESNISIHIEDRQLTVSGQIDETMEEKDGDQILRRERRSGQFRRSIALAGPANAAEMKAEYDGGVLTVTVPKGTETAQSKTIAIQ